MSSENINTCVGDRQFSLMKTNNHFIDFKGQKGTLTFCVFSIQFEHFQQLDAQFASV